MKPPLHPDVTVSLGARIRENTKDPRDGGMLRVELAYSTSDPCAAWFLLGDDDDRPAWVVSRDLVAAGVAARSGVGDARLWPEGVLLVVEFESPEGRFVFVLPRREVQQFLRSTFRLVRPGREDLGLGLDEAIARMRPEGWLL